MNIVYQEGVIPVLDTGIQLLIISSKMLYSVPVYSQFFWIPVSGHWDDTIYCKAYYYPQI
ncbi:hypothetical protein [Wolbachia endosymbiont (group A) of Ennomos erosarius]|uniref:hypothetical protein n=1 Tax=Wolbachia endosymbiont (group A) of Ennomos erosarius TaxID=3066174 RepID=UPI00397E5CFD